MPGEDQATDWREEWEARAWELPVDWELNEVLTRAQDAVNVVYVSRGPRSERARVREGAATEAVAIMGRAVANLSNEQKAAAFGRLAEAAIKAHQARLLTLVGVPSRCGDPKDDLYAELLREVFGPEALVFFNGGAEKVLGGTG